MPLPNSLRIDCEQHLASGLLLFPLVLEVRVKLESSRLQTSQRQCKLQGYSFVGRELSSILHQQSGSLGVVFASRQPRSNGSLLLEGVGFSSFK